MRHSRKGSSFMGCGKANSVAKIIEQGIWDSGVTIGNYSLGIGDWGLRIRKWGTQIEDSGVGLEVES